ncbi:hypothetical protein D3C71_1935190 [compost metagenome]
MEAFPIVFESTGSELVCGFGTHDENKRRADRRGSVNDPFLRSAVSLIFFDNNSSSVNEQTLYQQVAARFILPGGSENIQTNPPESSPSPHPFSYCIHSWR